VTKKTTFFDLGEGSFFLFLRCIWYRYLVNIMSLKGTKQAEEPFGKYT